MIWQVNYRIYTCIMYIAVMPYNKLCHKVLIWKKENEYLYVSCNLFRKDLILNHHVKGPNAKQNVWSLSLLSLPVKLAHPLTQILSYLLWNVVSNPLTLDLDFLKVFLLWSSSLPLVPVLNSFFLYGSYVCDFDVNMILFCVHSILTSISFFFFFVVRWFNIIIFF